MFRTQLCILYREYDVQFVASDVMSQGVGQFPKIPLDF